MTKKEVMEMLEHIPDETELYVRCNAHKYDDPVCLVQGCEITSVDKDGVIEMEGAISGSMQMQAGRAYELYVKHESSKK